MSQIIPVDVSTITAALQAQIVADARITGVTVQRSEDRNLDPGGCPWVGIYRLGVAYQQRVLGYGGGMSDQRVRLLVLAEEQDPTSGEVCEEKLEALVQLLVSAILSDTSLGGLVGAIESMEVDYTSYERSGSVYMQTAAIQFVAVGNTTVS